MAHYQFVAINPQGREQRGTVEADSKEQAIARLERHGLRPTQVERVTRSFGQNESPPPAAPTPDSYVPPASPMPSVPFPGGYPAPPRPRGRMLGAMSFLFSFLAFVTAAGTLGWVVFFRGGATGSLDRYDFSSAGNALKSMKRMEANSDYLAAIEFEIAKERFHDPKKQERLDEMVKTLKIKEELEWKEKNRVIVLFSYDEDGKSKQKAEVFERDKKTRRWLPIEGDWRRELEKKDEDLYKKVKKWED